MIIRRALQVAIVCFTPAIAHAQQTYQTNTYGPGYSVTTGPNGYHAESHEYSPGQVTTTVTDDNAYSSTARIMHQLCQGTCGDE